MGWCRTIVYKQTAKSDYIASTWVGKEEVDLFINTLSLIKPQLLAVLTFTLQQCNKSNLMTYKWHFKEDSITSKSSPANREAFQALFGGQHVSSDLECGWDGTRMTLASVTSAFAQAEGMCLTRIPQDSSDLSLLEQAIVSDYCIRESQHTGMAVTHRTRMPVTVHIHSWWHGFPINCGLYGKPQITLKLTLVAQLWTTLGGLSR